MYNFLSRIDRQDWTIRLFATGLRTDTHPHNLFGDDDDADADVEDACEPRYCHQPPFLSFPFFSHVFLV